MKSFMLLMLLFCGGVLLFLWIYLNNYATKADVWTWEQSYNVTFPAWMKNLPNTTGEVSESFFRAREKAAADIVDASAEVEENVKLEFQTRLDEMARKAKEKAQKEAHDLIDRQMEKMGTGK